jgi:hypothetical protein
VIQPGACDPIGAAVATSRDLTAHSVAQQMTEGCNGEKYAIPRNGFFKFQLLFP